MSEHDLPPTGPQPGDPPPATVPLAGSPPPRPLRRAERGRVLAGVAAGLGSYLGVDPVVLRIGFVVLTFVFFLGPPLYLLAWLTIPPADGRESVAEGFVRWVAQAPGWVKVLLGVVLAMFVLGGAFGDGSGLFWGVVLIALGIVLYRRNADVPTATGPGGAPAPQTTPLADPAAQSGLAAPGASSFTESWGTPAPAAGWDPVTVRTPRAARPPSLLGRITLAVILLATGIAALLDLGGVLDFTVERFLALTLAIIGLGLVVGARAGRARGLIVLGVFLLPVLAAVNLLAVPAGGGVGERSYTPQSVDDVRDEYRLFLGSSRVDLSEVDFAGTTTRVRASVGLGELIIVVPDDVTVEVSSEVRAGEIVLFGESFDGSGTEMATVDRGEEGGGRLVLDADAGLGMVTVRRADDGNAIDLDP